MVTLTEPAWIQCCAKVFELELQWDWMPEDIYSNKMNCDPSLLPPSSSLYFCVSSGRGKNLFLSCFYYQPRMLFLILVQTARLGDDGGSMPIDKSG